MKVKIKDVSHRREIVNAINEFDMTNGIKGAQRAKYELPNWFLVISAMCQGIVNDRKYSVSINDILGYLRKENIHLSNIQVRYSLVSLIKKYESIHSCRRAFGMKAFKVISELRNLKSHYGESVSKGRRPLMFHFGKSDVEKIKKVRRKYNLYMKAGTKMEKVIPTKKTQVV